MTSTMNLPPGLGKKKIPLIHIERVRQPDTTTRTNTYLYVLIAFHVIILLNDLREGLAVLAGTFLALSSAADHGCRSNPDYPLPSHGGSLA